MSAAHHCFDGARRKPATTKILACGYGCANDGT
jgi:hypothetical protein